MTRASALHVVVAAAAAWSLHHHARAQEPCRPLDCSTVPYLQSGQTWIPNPPNWTIDRRPVTLISGWNGNFCHNPYGHSGPHWYDHDEDPTHVPQDLDLNGIPDVFDWLLGQLNSSYQHGWRRMIFQLPAGSVFGQEMASAQWWPMPGWKRDGFKDYVKPWILAHPDANVGVYMNTAINDPCSLCQDANPYSSITWVNCDQVNYCQYCPTTYVGILPCSGRTLSHPPQPTSKDDTCIFHQNVEPWLDLGAKEIWFDAAAWHLYTPYILEMMNSPIYSGRMKSGGEAIPWAAHGVYDPALMLQAAWVGTSAYVDGQDPNHTWTFDITNTEAGYWIGRAMTLQEMHSFVGHGWVIWIHGIWDVQSNECAKRIYSAGVIHDIADYNGDGVTQDTDVAEFLDAYVLYRGITSRQFNYVHGDLNQDGYVTTADKDLFYTAFDFSLMGLPIESDYGAPDPDSAMP